MAQPSLQLVLLELDGVLLRSPDRAAVRAAQVALEQIFAVAIEEGEIMQAARGRTRREAWPGLLFERGIAEERVAAELSAALRLAAELYPDLLNQELKPWAGAVGAAQAVERLRTGGLVLCLVDDASRQEGRLRLLRLGLQGVFAPEETVFVAAADERGLLLQALGEVEPERAVLVCTTAREVEHAQAVGMRVCALADGDCPVAELRAADWLAADLLAAATVLAGEAAQGTVGI